MSRYPATTDAALAHLRADLDRASQMKGGRVPLTCRELGGLIARLEAAEAVCRTFAQAGEARETWTALGCWRAATEPRTDSREVAS